MSATVRHNYFRNLVCWLLIALMLVHPVLLYADAFTDAARSGQGFADSIRLSDPAGVSGGNITFGSGDAISVSELFPDTDTGSGGSNNYPHMRADDELMGEAGSDSGLSNMGIDALSNMRSEVASPGGPSSIQGMAYEVVHKASDHSRPSFAADPMMNQSLNVFADMEAFSNEFADCSVNDSFSESNFDVHMPDYHRCNVVEDRTTTCQLRHDYDAKVITHFDGPMNIAPCGEGCLNTWIGQVGDDYWSGNCTIYEEETYISVDNPEAITSAVLDRALWDDYMQVYFGPVGSETLIWESMPGVFPPETPGACELNTSWDTNPNLDLTHLFKSIEPGGVARFKIRVSVTGEGEGYGRINIQYDPQKAIIVDEWGDEECLEAASGVRDGYATADATCTNSPVGSGGCYSTNGVTICPHMLKPSPIPELSPLCRQAEVDVSYDFYKGTMDCWTDVNGNEVCEHNDGGTLDSCQAYETNPQCGFISTTCVDGARGDSGTCYVREDTYDCGTNQSVPTLNKSSEVTCGGPIRCMGSECFDYETETSPDFARASALLNAAQFMGQDLACSGTDEDGGIIGDADVQCTVFAGTPGECKKAVGGTVDCCEAPAGINLGDYLTMIMTVPKIDAGITSLEGTSADAVFGAYNALREPAMNSWSTVTQPFTSRLESASGAWDTLKGSVQDKVIEFTEPLREKVAEMTSDVIFGAAESAGAPLVEGAGSEAAESFSEQLLGEAGASFLGAAMTAYQIYVAAMLAIQLIWKCEQSEFEMNAQRELDSCHFVGSYCKSKVLGVCIEKREAHCCFSSPLSRILQEQVRAQTGASWGSAEAPLCAGIPVDTLQNIDWESINLDEWLGLLAQEGLYNGAGNFSMDSLTGAGSAFDVGGRLNTEDRTMERFNEVDIDGARQDAQGDLRSQGVWNSFNP